MEHLDVLFASMIGFLLGALWRGGLPLWRVLGAVFFAIVFYFLFPWFVNNFIIPTLNTEGQASSSAPKDAL